MKKSKEDQEYEEQLVWLFVSTGVIMVGLIIITFISIFITDWKDVRQYNDFSLGVIVIGTISWFVGNCIYIVLRQNID
jgi:uncharacterized membrane protein